MNLLDEMGGDHPLSDYASWLVNPDVDEGVAEKSAEILKEHAESVKEQLLSSLDKATQAQKLIIADVLVDASKDERTYALLKELFQATNSKRKFRPMLRKKPLLTNIQELLNSVTVSPKL